jgi:hypothetical protein
MSELLKKTSGVSYWFELANGEFSAYKGKRKTNGEPNKEIASSGKQATLHAYFKAMEEQLS